MTLAGRYDVRVRACRGDAVGQHERRLVAPTCRATIMAAGAVLGIAFNQPASAGNLNSCDLTRVAAHNVIQDAYARLLSNLDKGIAATRAEDAAAATAGHRNRDQAEFDLIRVRAELQAQERTDTGHADRMAVSLCQDGGDPVPAATRAANAIAARGMSDVLSRHDIDVDLSLTMAGL